MINKKIKNELIRSDSILSCVCGYSLDLEQRLAILNENKSNLIIAGAGSGKSLTMIGKIRYLIEYKGINPKDILVITFTSDAAKSLEEKINKTYNYGIKVYTFHKLALEFLKDKKYNIADPYSLNYIIDEYFYMIKFDNNMKMNVKKVLGLIDTSYNKILNSKELTSLKRLIFTFINLFKSNNYELDYFLKIKKNKDIIRIIIDIYLLYQEELKSTNSIDFNDMITKAIHNIKFLDINYKHIIVDEYQDTSYIRYLMLKEIVNKSHSKITCVGDDFQSIYRFNGCDIKMFLNFKRLFKDSKILKINNTYRNSSELIKVAGKFILKNKNQLYKNLKSNKHLDKPIKIMYGDNLKKLLDVIILKNKNILILGRNNFDIDKYFKVSKDGFIKYKDANIRYLTVHRSKGLECDSVVIINLRDDINGFPNKVKDNKILKYVNNNSDIYPFEEERRLFYVALTRTKGYCYLLVDKKNPSIFVKELIKDFSKYIEYI